MDVRSDFPILSRQVNGRPLVYLDNAASTQKPQVVIDAVKHYYEHYNANVHRGVHSLSVEATEAMEEARTTISKFIQAEKNEVIFTSGTTEGINILSQSWVRQTLGPDDEVIISGMEHHSNIVPWQMACDQCGAKLRIIPITDSGELDMQAFDEMLSERTRFLSVVHVSNTLGTINPIKTLIDKAHAMGAKVHVDGAQAVAHMPVDVKDLDVDFYTFSGHKIFGPTGTGVLYGKAELLEAMPPLYGGGEMIRSVSFEKTTYNEIPFKFEAGTPNIAGNIGLGKAIEYLSNLSWENIRYHELNLLNSTLEGLGSIEGTRIIGESKNRSGAISFLIGDIHPFDLGTLLDKMGIAVRTGHHCTEPLMDRFQIPGTVRASFSIYNSEDDVDRLLEAMERVVPMLA
ncbi:MAG: cysteine desulfurase [Flavobacteriales bacterium]|nr:cysteine desulfurase [Flavobacteriales bacterium]